MSVSTPIDLDPPKPVRVRFAPSPTGYLHTGGARTALFNYLWAEQAKRRELRDGVDTSRFFAPTAFVLRVEDTDEQRSTEESTRAILDGLKWLGINWDEGPDPDPARFGESIGEFGPYFQSQRRAEHQRRIESLLRHHVAFYCPATTEEMTGPDGRKLLFSPYRDATPEEQEQFLAKARAEGKPGLPVRLKCPRGLEVKWDDMVRGPISFQSDEIGDFIVQKSTGQILYNFAVTCDDSDMQITHVLRGEDHISNTPKQLLLYRALGWHPPVFGHVPLILGMDRARLSKRHGATRVEAYQEMGMLPEALVNFLALIGWAPKDNRELFSMDELIEAFNPADIGKSSGAFNFEKLEHFNGLYLRAMSAEEFATAALPYLPAQWRAQHGDAYCERALALYQDKLTLLATAPEHTWYFFQEPQWLPQDSADEATPEYGWYNAGSVAKLLTDNPDAPRIIGELLTAFEAVDETNWSVETLEPLVDDFCEQTGLGKGKVMQPWRVALTGDKVSPGFYDLLAVLGREIVLRRGKAWVERLGG